MTMFVTSDTHLGHRNVLFYVLARARLWANKDVLELAEKYAKDKNREELSEGINDLKSSVDESVQRMTNGIIDNWNSVVGPDDEVYHLGDFMMGQSTHWEKYLNRLQGKIYLTAGNHCKKFRKQQYVIDRMEWIKDYHEMTVKDPDAANGKNQMIVMQHYPLYTWSGASSRSSIMCHGHCHNSISEENKKTTRIDVGIDNPICNYSPISYSRLMKEMRTRKYQPVDHHDSDTNP